MNEPTRRRPSRPASTRRALAVPHGRQPQIPVLVGRRREATQLTDLVARNPLVTLTGSPGVGKSHLAVFVATRAIDDGSRENPIVSLGSVASRSDVEFLVAAATKGQDATDGALVVFDDCDWVLDACAEAAESLVKKGWRVLATAREPLQLPSERVFRLAPLPLPDPAHDVVSEVFASEAAQIFCSRSEAMGRPISETQEDARLVAAICRQVDGLPLALEMAAQVAPFQSLADLAERLDDPFRVLDGGFRTASPRHRSLTACFSWSFDRLDERHRALLSRLSVFRGPFEGAAAAAVSVSAGVGEAEVGATLRTLAQKSLLEVDATGSRTRYQLLRTTRRFAEAQLCKDGADQAVRRDYARWVAGLVQVPGADDLRNHHEDLHAGFDVAIEGSDWDVAARLALADSYLCGAAHRQDEVADRFERATRISPRVTPTLRSDLLMALGLRNLIAGWLDCARRDLEAVMGFERRAHERLEARIGLAAVTALANGDVRVLADADALVAEARANGDGVGLMDTLAASGRLQLLVGDAARASRRFKESLALAEEDGDDIAKAQALIGLGRSLVVIGQYEVAEGVLDGGIGLAASLGERHGEAIGLVALGHGARIRGDTESARRHYSDAARIAEAAGHPFPWTHALLGLAQLALDDGDLTTAKGLARRALEIATGCGIPYLVGPSVCTLAAATADRDKAGALLEQALATARACGDKTTEARALGEAADLGLLTGAATRATLALREALTINARIGDPAAIAGSLEGLGTAVVSTDVACTVRLIAAADRIRARHGSVRSDATNKMRDSALATARGGLDDARFRREWERGTRSAQAVVADAVAPKCHPLGRPSKGVGALTPAETAVAEQAAEGLTDYQIARKLHISTSTVKTHIRRVLMKLEITSRAAIATKLYAAGKAFGE